MLLAVSQDRNINNWCNNAQSGAKNWGTLNVLNDGGGPTATVTFASALKKVGASEALCITAHGNDTEIGDKNISGLKSWSWTYKEFADMLGKNLPNNYAGPILLEVCGTRDAKFISTVVAQLEADKKLNGVWIYSYQKSIDTTHTFPDPTKLSTNIELLGVQVKVPVHA